MAEAIPETMKAVVFHGPKKVAVEERPVPKSMSFTHSLSLTHTATTFRLSYENPLVFIGIYTHHATQHTLERGKC